MKVYTIGHSTRSLEEFVAILKQYGVSLLVDIRTVPRSRTNPQYNLDALGESLIQYGVRHAYVKNLGGLRPASKDSINMGWRNKSFRGYADYMQQPEFYDGLQQLLTLAQNDTVAIMCAEAVPWRCHRSMVGDALLVRDIEVIDIFDSKKSQPQTLTSFAKVDGTRIWYPAYEES